MPQKSDDRDLNGDERSGLVKDGNLGLLPLPCYVTAHFMYYATGEGLTRGIYMLFANDATELRRRVVAQWGEYFFVSAEFETGLCMIVNFEDLIPEQVRGVVEDFNLNKILPYTFSFEATIHKNCA